MRSWIGALAAVAAVAGCEGAAAPGPGGAHDARFVGPWQVDQPYHALYEATRYTFHDDGVLEHGDTCTFGAPADYQTGTVGRTDPAVTCRFGDRWWSEGDRTLVIEGACDDGARRAIALGFPADAAGNATGASVEVLAVDGEAGWAHLDFEWRWTSCAGAADCPPLCL